MENCLSTQTTLDKLLIIPFDYSTWECDSYVETMQKIEQGVTPLYTNCLHLFSFDLMNKGYNVKVLKRNGDYILMSELLQSRNGYTVKHIRKSHRLDKLLLGNCFEFKKGIEIDYSERDCEEVDSTITEEVKKMLPMDTEITTLIQH